MNLRKMLFWVLLLSSMTVVASEKKEPLLRASFDTGFTAEKAKGNKTGKFSAEEVNLETLVSFLRKGISGKAMFTGISGSGVDAKRFFCEYDALDNLNLKQGSLLFWVKPLDWNGDDKDFHVFFCAENKKEWMLVYKFGNSSDLLFLFGPKEKDEKGQWKWTVARANVKDWKMNQWHFIGCVWDEEFIKLYVDGKFAHQQKIKNNPLYSFEKITVGDIGRDKWKNIKGSSLIDELEIYDAPLNAEEIYAAYVKFKNASKPGKVKLKTGKRKPVTDGFIKEWEYAFAGTGFFNLKGDYASIQSRYAISYDDENIYIGVVSPKIGNFYDIVSERDGAVYRDDSVELFLMPEPDSNSYYQFIFNSKGVFFDAQKLDSSWNVSQDIKIANAFQNDKWTIEVAIPFKAIGVKPPEDGDKWKINICRTYPDVALYTAIAPVRHGYHESSNFAELVFSSDAPLLDIQSIGKMKNKFLLDLKVAAKWNGRDETIYVNSQYKNDGKQLVKSNGKLLLKTKGQGGSVGSSSPNGKGLKCDDGILNINVSNSLGGAAYSTVFHFSKEKPLKVAYFLTDIKKGILKASIKHNTPIPSGNDYSVNVFLTDKNGKSVAETSLHPDKLIYTVDLPIGSVEPGDYEIKLTLTNSKGKLLQEAQQPIAIPSTPAKWMDNKIGVTEKVPAPWSSLKVNEASVDCWGREYSFENNVFPAQILTQGQKLLAEPVFLSLDGKNISDGKTEMLFEDKKENEVHFSVNDNSGNITVKTKNLIEYDGFLWIDMELDAKEPTKIQSLALEIPLTPSCATLIHSMKKGYLFRQSGSGNVPAEGWSGNLFKKPIFWVGNEDVGIQWFAENLKGWMVDNKDKSVEIIPQKTKTTVKLNIIDHPVVLSGKRSISFGLMATPVKPKIKTWRNVRLKRNVQPWFPYNKLFNYPDKNYVKDTYKKEKYWYRKCGKICYYHALYMISPFIPEWPYWGEQWSLTPPPFGTYVYDGDPCWTGARVCLNSPSYRDFYIWKLAGAVKDVGIKDLYFDLGVPRECRNENHGCGWKDHKGAVYNTYNILGTRELAKRIYIMMKDHNPDAFVLNHMSEEPAMPVLSFADFMVDGELFCKEVGEDKSYYNAFSPDFFRAEFMSRQWGPASFFIPQFKRSAQLYVPGTEKFWDSPQARKPYRHFTGYILVHDAKCWPNFGIDFKDVWKIQDQFGWDDKLKFVPYWDENTPLKVLEPSNARIMASLYQREGKAMAVVMNDTNKDEEVKLELAPEALDGKKISSAKDAETGESITLDGNLLKVKVPLREYRILLFE